MTEIPLEWKLNIWLVLGTVVSVAWLLLVAIAIRPTTRKGLAWWVLPVVAVGVVAPLGWRFLVWLTYALEPVTNWLTDYWWVFPVGGCLAFLAVAAVWLYRHERAQAAQMDPPIPNAPQVVAQPVQMWSLPEGTPQWDTDSLKR